MISVGELNRGDLFTLPIEGSKTVYEFLEWGQDTCRVRTIMQLWPRGSRGKGQPAAWLLTRFRKTDCNSCAQCKLLQ